MEQDIKDIKIVLAYLLQRGGHGRTMYGDADMLIVKKACERLHLLF